MTIKETHEDNLMNYITMQDDISKLLGFSDINEMEKFRLNAQQGMIQFGGSFARALGYALTHADSVNTYKILKIFRLECEEHAELHIKIMEKRKDQEHEVNI